MNQINENICDENVDYKYNNLLSEDEKLFIRIDFSENKKNKFRNILCKYNNIHKKEYITHRVHILSIKSKLLSGKSRLLCDVCCKELNHMYDLLKSRSKNVGYKIIQTLQEYQKDNKTLSLKCKNNHFWTIPWQTKEDIKVSLSCNECKNNNKILKISRSKNITDDFKLELNLNTIIIKIKMLKSSVIFEAFKNLLYYNHSNNLFNDNGNLVIEIMKKKFFDMNIFKQIPSIKIINETLKTITISCKKLTKEEYEKPFKDSPSNNINKKKNKNSINTKHYNEIIEYVVNKYSTNSINQHEYNLEQNKVNKISINNSNYCPELNSKVAYEKFVDLLAKRNKFEYAYNDNRDYRGEVIYGLTDPVNYLLAKDRYDKKYYEFREKKQIYVQPLYYNGRENKGEENINHIIDFNYKFNNFIEEIIFHPAIKTPIKNNDNFTWSRPKLLFDDQNLKLICDYSSDYELANGDENKKLEIVKKIKNVVNLIRKMYIVIENYYYEHNHNFDNKNTKKNKLFEIYAKFDNFHGIENWESSILLNDVMYVVSHIDEDTDNINPIMILTNLFILRNVNKNVICQTTIRNNKKIIINEKGIVCILKDNNNTLDMLTTMAAHKKFFIDNGALKLFIKIVYSLLKFPSKTNKIFDIRFKLFDKINIIKEVITEELFGAELKPTTPINWDKITTQLKNINLVSERFDIIDFAADFLNIDLKNNNLNDDEILNISRFLLILQTMDSSEYGTVTLACKHYVEKSFIKTILSYFPHKNEIINNV